MSYKITTKKTDKLETHSKVYIKLIALEFDTKKVSKAKEHYKKVYKSLCLDLSGKEWY